MTIQLLTGDCRDVLPTLPAESVHTVVTSPPYYALRSYLDASHPDKHREIGSEATPEAYLATMVQVFREVRRVLRPDGTVWCNVGDSFCSGTNAPRKPTTTEGDDVPASWANRSQPERTTGGGLAAKQLLLMPARLALALQADGWWVRSDIIWHKPNPMPESCTDRPTSAHEHVFLLTRSSRYYYDADAVREDGDGRPPREARSQLVNNLHSSLQLSGRGEFGGASRNLRNVWTLATHAFPEAHFATYPPELVERCIKAGTSERGCCAACGKPWVRVTQRNLDNVPTRMATKRAPVDREAMAAYLRERREALGLTRAAVDEALGTRTLYSWFEGRPAGIEPPTPEQWTKLREVLALDARFDEQIYATVEVEITDHSPSKAPGVRTYAKAWNAETETLGWSPGCKCDAGDPTPCTVLDPFSGAGTTLLCADRLQRHAIGIDLSLTYAEMAQRRIELDCPLFTSWAPAEPPEDERQKELFLEPEYGA